MALDSSGDSDPPLARRRPRKSAPREPMPKRVVQVAREAIDDGLGDPQKLSASPQSQSASFVIVHIVECLKLDHHKDHVGRSYYMDVPRLFAGDSKAIALRGKNNIALDETGPASFVVYRTYDCAAYQRLCEPLFETLASAEQRSKMPLTVQAHLSVLPSDGPLAAPEHESIEEFQGRMLDAVRALDLTCDWHLSSNHDHASDWSLEAPYNEIFHCRDTLQTCRSTFDPLDLPYIDCLVGYVSARMAADYKEADDLFERGKVSEKHLPKLFRLHDRVVTKIDGEEVAALCYSVQIGISRRIRLGCRLWAFDGLFRTKSEALIVSWPHEADTPVLGSIPITQLFVYPLRYGEEGLRERLIGRGSMLWSCRFRKFVGYNAPRHVLDVQAVRIS